MSEVAKKSYELVDAELGATIKIVTRDWADGGLREMNKKTRVFVWGVENLPEVVVEDVTLPKPKMKGEDFENDKVYARRNRVYAKASCDVAKTVLEHIAEVAPELKALLPNLTFRFSVKAGCSCPCSPGVVTNDTVILNGERVDFYITLLDPSEPKMR